jgi:hypothetical protein
MQMAYIHPCIVAPDEEAVAIRKEDWPAIHQAIADAIAPLKPRGWRRALFLLREFGILGANATIIVALLALAASAFYQANTRVAKEATFETNTARDLEDLQKELKEIRGDLAKQTVSAHAALPLNEFKASLLEIASPLSILRSQRVDVPSNIVESLGQKLVQVVDTQPVGFWPVAAGFISYRSLLSSPRIPSVLPNCTDRDPTLPRVKSVEDAHHMTVEPAYYENCKVTLDSSRDTARINELLLNLATGGIAFKNCIVVYRGGEIKLILAIFNHTVNTQIMSHDMTKVLSGPNMTTINNPITLRFENCLFDFEFKGTPPEKGQMLARTLLPENKPTFEFKVTASGKSGTPGL